MFKIKKYTTLLSSLLAQEEMKNKERSLRRFLFKDRAFRYKASFIFDPYELKIQPYFKIIDNLKKEKLN